jgi:hypothetical protein
MLDGIATIFLCKTLAGPNTAQSFTPSGERYGGLHVKHLTNYFLRTPTPNASVIGLESSDQELLPQFVQTAHANVRFSIFLPFRNSQYIRK